MARLFLENKAFYVADEDKHIYEVNKFEAYDGYDVLNFNLELVAGWDYVNPDMSDVQGWCPSDMFVEDIQNENVIVYMMSESVENALEANGYELVESERMSAALKEIIKKHKEKR